MKAFHIDATSGPDGLVLRESPDLCPGPKQVLVKVHARSLNLRDLLILHGRYPVPATPGTVAVSDGAGEVVAVGADVTRVAVGDRVMGAYFPRWQAGRISMDILGDQFGCTRDGALAPFMLLDEQAAVKVPANLSYEQASTLPCAGVTAWTALTGPRPVLAGETVLTIGTGGVALFALQFAKAMGARVVAVTSSAEKLTRLRELGADLVLNRVEDPEWHVAARAFTGGVDHAVETGGLETIEKSAASLGADGVLSVVAMHGPGSLDTMILAGAITLRRVYVGSRSSFEAMNRSIEANHIQPVIAEKFAFAQTKAAYHSLATRQAFGKLVIQGD